VSDVAHDFARFMQRVQVRSRHECWEWLGHYGDGRYGYLSVGGKSVRAHRWLFALLHGAVADDEVVRHKCDNPRCVNPTHLEIGTYADNTRDKFDRGRAPNRQGSKHPLARMTEADVVALRKAAELGETHEQLAARFGLSRAHVGKITRRENWRHI